MFEEENDDLLGAAYRNYIAREVGRPEVAQAKKQFMAKHFSPRPKVFSMAPAVVAPVFVMAAVFALFNHLQTALLPVEGPLAPIYGTSQASSASAASAQKEAAPVVSSQPLGDNPVANYKKPRVDVKRVSSAVGPTMVYQKLYRNVPVTVVWVFAGGKH